MTRYTGLTWDHPRGRQALEAAAQRLPEGLAIDWHVQPLEGFESTPIDRLTRDYDLIVLDHPHLGDAVAGSGLQRLDELFDAATIEAWSAGGVGPSFESYRMAGGLWALPLDAATQVAARRPDLLGEAPPDWEAVRALSREAPVALNLAGPHAFLTLCSIAVALGEEPRVDGSDPLLSRATLRDALDLMREITSRAPDGSELLNPIGLLNRMAGRGDIAYCPLVYGYVNFSAPGLPHPIAFSDAPRGPAGRPGSTIGGTGMAVSRRATVTPPLLEHLSWLMSADAQQRFIPQHAGQPSSRAAWLDPAVNADAGDFYRNTVSTVERSWVRPRFAGYIPFQSAASAVVREVALGRIPADDGAAEVARLHHDAGRAGSTPTD
ncbi:MAG: multiple sugar transport system substrate-binding protein [Microbacteriaceae bacterium]|nr:multiple sugar transport system substrate-binding protein [Microbacteriaceae bacterium]